jgi:hypothetical protein
VNRLAVEHNTVTVGCVRNCGIAVKTGPQCGPAAAAGRRSRILTLNGFK